jgi:hypothetical protein
VIVPRVRLASDLIVAPAAFKIPAPAPTPPLIVSASVKVAIIPAFDTPVPPPKPLPPMIAPLLDRVVIVPSFDTAAADPPPMIAPLLNRVVIVPSLDTAMADPPPLIVPPVRLASDLIVAPAGFKIPAPAAPR